MAAKSIWGYRATFVGLSALIFFFALLPFDAGDGNVPGPDLVIALVAAWVLRRPDYLPVWLLVIVLLLGDFVLMRPLGLWTLIVFCAAGSIMPKRHRSGPKLVWSRSVSWRRLQQITWCLCFFLPKHHRFWGRACTHLQPLSFTLQSPYSHR